MCVLTVEERQPCFEALVGRRVGGRNKVGASLSAPIDIENFYIERETHGICVYAFIHAHILFIMYMYTYTYIHVHK